MDKIKVFLAHVFSLHTLVAAFGLALTYTANVPSLAAWHAVLAALGTALGITGFGMAAVNDPQKQRARAARWGSKPPVPPAALLILIPLLAVGCGLPSLKDCATPTPAIQKKC